MSYLWQTSREGKGIAKCSMCMLNCQKYERLSCDHKFCESCLCQQISKLTSVKEHESVTIVCPYCRDFFFSKIEFLQGSYKKSQRQKTVDFAPIRRDPGLSAEMAKRCEPCAEMREYETSSFWCHTCSEYMCSSCAHYHTKMKMSKNHVVKTLKDKEKYGDIKSKVYEPMNMPRTPRSARATSPHTPRREHNKLKCEPCGETRHIVEAKYTCQNCNERLCENCAKCHRSMKLSKSHKLAKLSELRSKTGVNKREGDTCDRHYGESMSLYCKRCKTSCCSICVITSHSNCGSTTKLPSKSTKDTHWKTEYENKPNYYQQTKAGLYEPSLSTWAKKGDTVKLSKPGDTKTKIAKNKMENRKSRLACGEDIPGNWVISIALMTSGDMLLTELLQPNLKRMDSSGNLLSSLNFVGDPWSVAVYNDSLAALTFSDRKEIQLVNVQSYGGLEAGRRFNTRHRCMAVCFAKDQIVASCWEGCIHVFNIKGTELCSIDKDNYGDRLFTNPEYIAANRLGTTIYVTDYKRDTVTALKLLPYKIDNKPEFVFKNKDLTGPKGIAVDRYGVLYISGMMSRNIFRLSPTGDLVQIYQRRGDTDYYEALAVSTTADKLYVSAYEDDTVIVFKMTN